jgi:hypothetical protein
VKTSVKRLRGSFRRTSGVLRDEPRNRNGLTILGNYLKPVNVIASAAKQSPTLWVEIASLRSQ